MKITEYRQTQNLAKFESWVLNDPIELTAQQWVDRLVAQDKSGKPLQPRVWTLVDVGTGQPDLDGTADSSGGGFRKGLGGAGGGYAKLPAAVAPLGPPNWGQQIQRPYAAPERGRGLKQGWPPNPCPPKAGATFDQQKDCAKCKTTGYMYSECGNEVCQQAFAKASVKWGHSGKAPGAPQGAGNGGKA